ARAGTRGWPPARITRGGQATLPTRGVKGELGGGCFQGATRPLPAVLTIKSGTNQLRYATLRGIRAAKKKEIKAVTPAAAADPKLKISALYVPEKTKKTQLIEGAPAAAAKELVRRLREEARVI